MPDKILYEYAVIRFLPKAEREEFINIGVILYSRKKNFLKVRFDIDSDRIQTFAKDCFDIHDQVKSWSKICSGSPEGGTIGTYDMAFRFRWLTANRSTLIQSSPVHPGQCIDPQQKLDELFDFYVG